MIEMIDTLPVYIIVNLSSVTNKDVYRKYEKGFFSILKKHRGEFITYDDNAETLEGDSPREGRMIIVKFPSEQAAKKWYNDPEYQTLSEYRREGTKLEFMTIVKGIPPRK